VKPKLQRRYAVQGASSSSGREGEERDIYNPRARKVARGEKKKEKKNGHWARRVRVGARHSYGGPPACLRLMCPHTQIHDADGCGVKALHVQFPVRHLCRVRGEGGQAKGARVGGKCLGGVRQPSSGGGGGADEALAVARREGAGRARRGARGGE
jgi:hypothetical protein